VSERTDYELARQQPLSEHDGKCTWCEKVFDPRVGYITVIEDSEKYMIYNVARFCAHPCLAAWSERWGKGRRG